MENDLYAARRMIDQLMPDADEDEHRMFAEHLAKAVDEYGFANLGEQLRESYDLQRINEPTPPDANPPGDNRAEPRSGLTLHQKLRVQVGQPIGTRSF